MKDTIPFTTGIRDLISIKSGVTYIIDRNCAKIKVDSYDFLPLEKTVML